MSKTSRRTKRRDRKLRKSQKATILRPRPQAEAMQTLIERLSETERQVITLGLDRHLTYIIRKWEELDGRERRADIIGTLVDLPVWVILRIGQDCRPSGLTQPERARLDRFLRSITK